VFPFPGTLAPPAPCSPTSTATTTSDLLIASLITNRLSVVTNVSR